jgi:hypothetical protein
MTIVPVEALKLLGDDGLSLMTHLINNNYESGEWPKDFSELNNGCIKEEAKS